MSYGICSNYTPALSANQSRVVFPPDQCLCIAPPFLPERQLTIPPIQSPGGHWYPVLDHSHCSLARKCSDQQNVQPTVLHIKEEEFGQKETHTQLSDRDIGSTKMNDLNRVKSQ